MGRHIPKHPHDAFLRRNLSAPAVQRQDVVYARGQQIERPPPSRELSRPTARGALSCHSMLAQGQARDDRQRQRIPIGAVQRLAGGRGHRTQAHRAPRPLAERQGRAHEQDVRAGVAVRPRLRDRGGAHGTCGSPPTSRVIGEKRYGTQQLHPPRGCSLEGVSGWVRGTFSFLNDLFPTKWRTSNCSNKFVWTAVIFGRAEKSLAGGAARTIPIACLAFHVSCAGVPRRRPGRPT